MKSSPWSSADDAGALDEDRGAGGVVLDQLGDRIRQRRRHNQPAQPPARHRPGFGEAVDRDDAILRLGDVEEGRRARAFVVQAFIDLVGQDPGARAAAMRQDRLLLLPRQGEAGRVARRVQQHQPRLRRDRRQQPVEIHPPQPLRQVQRHGLDRGREDQRDGADIRPVRRQGDHLVARVQHRLAGQHDGIDAGAGGADAVHGDLAAVPLLVAGDGVAQRIDAEVGGVEGLPRRQRLRRRTLDEVRRRGYPAPRPRAG